MGDDERDQKERVELSRATTKSSRFLNHIRLGEDVADVYALNTAATGLFLVPTCLLGLAFSPFLGATNGFYFAGIMTYCLLSLAEIVGKPRKFPKEFLIATRGKKIKESVGIAIVILVLLVSIFLVCDGKMIIQAYGALLLGAPLNLANQARLFRSIFS